MADVSDVARFTQAHGACGGIVQAVTTQSDGGYLLTLTCRCGAVLDRRVTPDEAKLAPFTTPPIPAQPPSPPLPTAPATPPQRVTPSPGTAPTRPTPPPAAAPPPAATQRPRATPSPEMEAVMRAALEAEAAATPPPSAPPKPQPGSRTRGGSDEGSKLTPSPDLEAVLREALQAESAPRAAEAPPAKGPARPGRVAPPKLDVGDTVKEALRQQKLMKEAGGKADVIVQRSTRATAWIIVALLFVAAGIGGVWYTSTVDEPPEQLSGPPAPGTEAARPAVSSVSIDQAFQALRALQSAIGPSLSLPAYQARVAAAQNALGPFLESSAPAEAKTIVRETLDIYVLAGAGWQARSADSREVWEAIGRSPALELCSSVKQAADAVGPGQARGRVIGSSITTLWECADRRIAKLDRLRAAR